jgi:hypothetical protein
MRALGRTVPAPMLTRPVKGRVFLDVTFEGQRFQGWQVRQSLYHRHA